jgi:hypothetical protein
MKTIDDVKRIQLEKLSCQKFFDEWEAIDNELTALLTDRYKAEQTIGMRKSEVIDAELMASMNVDGKNESERKVQKAFWLQKDQAYQAATTMLRQAESYLAQIDVEIDQRKRKIRRLEAIIRQRTEILAFLA